MIARLGKRKDPYWLKAYQDRMGRATRIAAEETTHLRGPERVREMSRLIGVMMKQPSVSPSGYHFPLP